MGVGMQIVYLGFVGTPQIEAEAGTQLVRLGRFLSRISSCHLAIEAMGAAGAGRQYDVRLDLLTRTNRLIPIEHCLSLDPLVALRAAFDAAEQVLTQNHVQSVVPHVSHGAFSDRLNDMENNIMYEHILVAVDGSESSKRALGEAIRMATLSHGKVTAVYVLEHSTTFAYAGEYDPLALTRAMRSDGERVLAEASEQMAQHQVTGVAEIVETEGLSEDVASCLQRVAQRVGASLVVLGTHGRRGVKRMVIGSVAERFVRFSTCPVLLVRDAQPAH